MKRLVLIALAASLIFPLALHAQPPAPLPLDAAARKAAVDGAADQLRTRYVFPDVGAKAADRLQAELAAGAYDGLDNGAALAARLTTDIAEVAHDKHIRVSYQGPPPPPQTGQGGPPPGPPLANEGGVTRADKLVGNIGYLEIVGFPPPGEFKPAIDRAMASLADTSALIIDARRNGGGSAEAVAYMESFFQSNDKPVHLLDFHNRIPNTDTFRTNQVMSVPTPTKYLGKKVYILTSGRTFSGGEGLSYNMQAMRVAQTVGEVTGGGANPGGVVPIASRFAMFVPNGRPESPVTHTNWEGKGVIPDIETPAPEALRVALQKLGQSPAAAGIEELSQSRVFAPTPPRAVAMAGTEAALRQVVDDLISGAPHYETMTPQMAEITKAQLTQLHQTVSGYGAVKSIAFKEGDRQGRDSYDVTFDKGVIRFVLGLDAAGKVAAVNFRPLN